MSLSPEQSSSPPTPSDPVTLQKWTLAIHAVVVIVVVAAATVLAFKRIITADAIVGLFLASLGFSGVAAAYNTGAMVNNGKSH